MKKTEEKTEYPQITPVEFELILEKYGMSKAEYCNLRGKTRSWFYEGLRTKRYVPIVDIETLITEIGYSIFIQLINEVKQKNNEKEEI